MNQSLIEYGGRMSRMTCKPPHPWFGREPLLGFIPTYIFWNLLVILLVAGIFYWLLRGSRGKPETAMDVLKKRYAGGEISKNEYLEVKKEIME